MKRLALLAALPLALSLPALAADEPVTPTSIVNSAPQEDWVVIPPEELLVMTLAPDAEGNPRRVVIQLMPPPFSQGWVSNIRTLAAAHYWDGTSVYRVQDNYVTQWGDLTEEKPLPEGLKDVPESDYVFQSQCFKSSSPTTEEGWFPCMMSWGTIADAYVSEGNAGFSNGWPLAQKPTDMGNEEWPIHCYGMVGVARSLDSTGMGTDLYTVIGHAPRQLDRNIALVGRIIDGMENLSALPRGKGELGFYGDDEADKRVPILSVRLGNELETPLQFEYLSTESDSFAAYAHSRANRQDDFYKVPAGGVDVCNVPVPVRAFEYND